MILIMNKMKKMKKILMKKNNYIIKKLKDKYKFLSFKLKKRY